MRVSELLTEGVEKFLDLAPETQTHLEDKENPHGVTKAQLGLQNVINEKQATDADFRSHKLAAVLDHPDGSITASKLAGGSVTKEKLANGAVGCDALEEGCITADRLAMTVRNSIAEKVAKEEGMGLSQNSFTNGEKAKLASISIKDGEGLTVDTETLVLKDSPLLLKKEGRQFVNTTAKTLSSGVFSEIIGTDFDANNSMLSVWGRKADGTYVVLVRDYQGKTKTYTGTVNTVCHCIWGATVYFGEMEAATVTIQKDEGSGAQPWRTLTTRFSSKTELWQMFFNDYDDMRLVYFSQDGSVSIMHVERFNGNGEREWSFTTSSSPRGNYDENSTVYKRRFRMAYTEGDDLYIAPVLDTTRKHAVLRIDGNGTLTGSYMPVTNFTSNLGILQDILVRGGIIYGYVAGHILRIDTVRERTNRLFYCGTLGNKTKGISMGTKGDLYAVTTDANGNNRLYQLDGDGAADCRSSNKAYVEAEMENVPLDAFVQATDKGVEMLRLNEGKLVSTLYVATDVYAIM